MLPKPAHLAPKYGAQFRDKGVVDAYSTRPPYPTEVFDILVGLIPAEPRTVLELGCGTGDIARQLAPRVARLDAVDPSPAMVERGKVLADGQHPHLRWICQSAEDFAYDSHYALVIAAESLHWMDWYTVLPKIGGALSAHGRLAIILGRGLQPVPWERELGPLIGAYSTNKEYQPYDLLQELATRHLFTVEQHVQTVPIPFTQPVHDYIESFHSRNGLSRERMGSTASAFDERLQALISRHTQQDRLSFELVAELAWGMPAGAR